MSRAQQIYLNSPIFLQELLVAIQGRQIHIQRYGGPEKEFFRELLKSQYKSPDELKDLQSGRLADLISSARENIPYYRDRADAYPIPKSVVDLSNYPVLDKQSFRANLKSFYDPDLKPSERILLNTSGTTGTPLVIQHDLRNIRYAFALLERHRSWAGISLKDRRATFGGQIIHKPESDNPPFWRFNPSENQMLFSSYHMSEKNLHHYARKLIEFKPAEIVGYPSSLHTLARFLKVHSEYEIHPKAVLTNSEPLYDYQRQDMIDTFRCGVFDWYGSVEYICFAGRCENGNLHIASEFGIIEILDDNNNPCPPLIEGEIVCTGLMNYGTPLIRYKLGDRGKLSDKICDCGRTLPILAEVTGRSDDIILTPEGRAIGRMDPIFKGLVGISECQIVQDEPDHLLFRLVSGPGYGEPTKTTLIKNAQLRLGTSMKIDIEEVLEIERGPHGKFKAVVSKIRNTASRI